MSGPSTETPTLELHFKPVAFWGGAARGWLNLVMVVAGLALGAHLMVPGLWRHTPPALLLLSAGVVALLLVATVRARRKPQSGAPLRAYATHLELPEAAGSPRTRRVDYADILSLNISGNGPSATLFVGTRNRLLTYPEHAFIESESIERLSAEVRRQLERQPGGDQLIARMNLRDAIGQAAWATRPVATVILLASLVVVAAVTLLGSSGADDAPFALVRYGANSPILVQDGQWFRLFSANFLHANFFHLYMNGFGLLTLGALLERLLGPWRFTLIYLISALGGSIASALMARAPSSVGASTAIFGLLGALAVLEWRFRTELPGGFRQTPRWWMVILGLNAALPLLIPQIDGAAHAGGFVAGALVTLVLCSHKDTIRRARPAPSGVRLATAFAVLGFAVALGAACVHAARSSADDQLLMEQAMVASGSADAPSLNAIAWQYAIASSPSPAELELADRAATSATTLEPESLEIRDTLATVQYRRGHFDRAIELERQVLAKQSDDFTFSQVARFLASRLARGGILGVDADAVSGDISVELLADEGAGGQEIALRVGTALPRGAEIWVLATKDGELTGALVLRVGPMERQGRARVVPKGNDSTWADGKPLLAVALVDATACRSCPAGTLEAEYRRMDASARVLPRRADMSNR